MASFFLAEIKEIRDPEMYREYVNRASPVVRRYGGVYVLRSDHITSVSGAWTPQRLILIRFDTIEDLRRCFASEAYLAIKSFAYRWPKVS
jgi:uncharacterized protein (DUF1330 family)